VNGQEVVSVGEVVDVSGVAATVGNLGLDVVRVKGPLIEDVLKGGFRQSMAVIHDEREELKVIDEFPVVCLEWFRGILFWVFSDEHSRFGMVGRVVRHEDGSQGSVTISVGIHNRRAYGRVGRNDGGLREVLMEHGREPG